MYVPARRLATATSTSFIAIALSALGFSRVEPAQIDGQVLARVTAHGTFRRLRDASGADRGEEGGLGRGDVRGRRGDEMALARGVVGRRLHRSDVGLRLRLPDQPLVVPVG